MTADTPVTIVPLSTVASAHTPSGMAAQAAMLIGASVFQSAWRRTCGKSCSDTISSIATIVTTIWAEPNRMAKIGAISMAEPKPAKPRISPATSVTPIAVHRPVSANRWCRYANNRSSGALALPLPRLVAQAAHAAQPAVAVELARHVLLHLRMRQDQESLGVHRLDHRLRHGIGVDHAVDRRRGGAGHAQHVGVDRLRAQ